MSKSKLFLCDDWRALLREANRLLAEQSVGEHTLRLRAHTRRDDDQLRLSLETQPKRQRPTT